MKQKLIFCLVLLTQAYFIHAQQADWKIAGDKLLTKWTQEVNPTNVLPEYPRPQMVRSHNWINLNGLWEYTILSKTGQDNLPVSYSGNILVPFAIESSLSGVSKTVGKDSVLWYRKTISLPSTFKNKNTLLHFGAVDWLCDIFVNGQKVGSHQGGYDPFSIDITTALKKGTQQQLAVRVWDPSDDGPQPRGKQIKSPNGIWYTPVTGIWQTVWLEAVPKTYIITTRQTPDVDKQSLTVSAQLQNSLPGDMIKISAWDATNKVAEQTISSDGAATLAISNPKLWSEQNPFLYDVKISVERSGKIIDEVKSYAAMRKISIGPDNNGVQRLLLNDKFIFQYGPLDQGWWPDGLYTAPTDEAMKFDIVKTKEMGFNMIRKHVKVEPARWYYYCDQMGMLVWQDMPSGDLGNHWDPRPFVEGRGTEKNRTPESEKIYRTEWNAIIDALYNFPSIVVWTPFNEAWGQFKTEEIVDWTTKKDPSRLINTASGGNYYQVGHIIDMHNYPEPVMPNATMFGTKQAVVLGEFGGLGLPLDGHTWQQRNWGYQSFGTADSLLLRYEGFMISIPDMIKKGLSAAVYTQTTDVEGEVNGLMTYDRKVMKMPVDKLKQMHSKFYDPSLVKMK
ncbi:MAG: sugar-binding domain-containing protein [Chitinophagaceae bacterium]